MGFSLGGLHVNVLIVFLEGLFSFFSPCVLPILPVYMGYLAGQTDIVDAENRYVFSRKHIMRNTLFFVFGLAIAFILLGLAFTTLGQLLSSHRLILTRSAGIFIGFMGLLQLGFYRVSWLEKDRRFSLRINAVKMSPWWALLMGFAFSFAWTPCVGPALSSVLMMASSTEQPWQGIGLVAGYALGFAVPFIMLGLFTTQALNWLDRHAMLLRHGVKLGGILLILVGVMLYTGFGNSGSSYVNQPNPTVKATSKTAEEAPKPMAFDFELSDQNGKTHKLSDYKGKVVFLNFWATWCPPCREEMPHIQALYERYGKNEKDVVFLSVAGPNQGKETDEAGIKTFLTEHKYNWPVVMDTSGAVFKQYQISALPTTFMIDAEGKIYGYVSGQLTEAIMKQIIEETKNHQ